MSEDHRKTLAELAITDLERTANEYRTMAATASTVAVRNSLMRLADKFERLVERKQGGAAPATLR